MELIPVKMPPICPGDDLLSLIEDHLPTVEEGDVLVVTSKIISLWENNGVVVPLNDAVDKISLIEQESDYYLPPQKDAPHPFYLTLCHHLLIPSSGIDESNGNGHYVLYPKHPFESAARLWEFVKSTRKIHHLGIIISDSHTTPLRRGVVGVALAWCGFQPILSYKGQPDCFGRPLMFTSRNNVDGLAASAVFMMGEGDEQTPLCLIKGAPRLVFQDNPPQLCEIDHFRIPIHEDVYAPLLQVVEWKKGGRGPCMSEKSNRAKKYKKTFG